MLTTTTQQPVLTKIAAKVLQNPEDFVGLSLFPLFPTPLMSSTYYVVDDAAMVTPPAGTLRSPGSAFSRSQTRLSDDIYSTESYGHEEVIPREENAKYARPGAAQEVASVRAERVILLGHEQRTAAEATSGAVPNAAVALGWKNPNSNPIGDVGAARQAIFAACALEANVMTVSRAVYETLKDHPVIKAMIKISSKDSRWRQLLAALFDVERFEVSKGVVNIANEGQAVSLSEIWADNVMLAHVDFTGDLMAPSFGRTFIVTDEETPDGVSVETYGEELIAAATVRASQQTAEKLTGPGCGFRLYGVMN